MATAEQEAATDEQQQTAATAIHINTADGESQPLQLQSLCMRCHETVSAQRCSGRLPCLTCMLLTCHDCQRHRAGRWRTRLHARHALQVTPRAVDICLKSSLHQYVAGKLLHVTRPNTQRDRLCMHRRCAPAAGYHHDAAGGHSALSGASDRVLRVPGVRIQVGGSAKLAGGHTLYPVMWGPPLSRPRIVAVAVLPSACRSMHRTSHSCLWLQEQRGAVCRRLWGARIPAHAQGAPCRKRPPVIRQRGTCRPAQDASM